MRVLVLGAGIVGITTAYRLAEEGHSVSVVDRQPAAGLETSFANGSQLVAHGGNPWSAPGVSGDLLRWLGRADAPLLLRIGAIPGLWRWGPQFLKNCTPERWRANATSLHHLARLSLVELDAIMSVEDIAFDERRDGIMVVHRNVTQFASAVQSLPKDIGVGMRKRAISAEECRAIEPALAQLGSSLAGGVYSPDDRTGDCLKFTQALAEAAAKRGVSFHYNTQVGRLRRRSGRVVAVETSQGVMHADQYVLCLGSYSKSAVRGTTAGLPIYPVKGYSITIPTGDWSGAPKVSLIDATRKMGFSRLGDRLRIAGTAEFAGYSDVRDPRRSEMLTTGLREMFPDAPVGEARHWTGLRPMTPDGVPLVGRSSCENLVVNSGHGTLGWSLAAGSARLVADILAGRESQISREPYRPHRY